MGPAPPSLTETLILALTQSKSLQNQLLESNRIIERLQRENEKLRRELHESCCSPKQDEGSELSVQLDQLFRKDAENQAEIDHLKSKLRMVQAKERKWRLQNPLLSSPFVSSDEADAHATPSTISRKRVRTKSPGPQEPLRVISSNLPAGGDTNRRSHFQKHSDRGAEAIPFIAEDGEDHNRVESDPTTDVTSGADQESSPHQRLQALLAEPAQTTPVLPRSNSVRRPPFLFNKPRSIAEDGEPFRSRPLNRLNLSHFRINPIHTGGCDYAHAEAERNQEAKHCLPGCTRPDCCGAKFRMLAETLPHDPTISEDDLLLDLLGPGSEDKIRALTPLARINLVHEARAKRLANLYGKHRTAFERENSPPGFWSTDMPGTQEEKENREQARVRDREEVERRYEEAMKGDGRWLFADE